MKPLGRWSLLVAAILVCGAAGFGAYRLAGVSWNGVVDYTSPFAGLTLPRARPASAETSRTVLIIIDGLRLDASRKMTTLNTLREYGTDLTLTAPQPSLSYPNWTTILSGAPPEISGVVTNWHKGPAPVETLFDTAKADDRKTVFVGPKDFEQLYSVTGKTKASFMRVWSERYLTGTYVDQALRLASAEKPDLLVMHLPDVDEAGHAAGGASKRYAQTVARVDGDLRRLVEGLQDSRTVFVVVADHGHIDTGGHGGWETEVTSVPGIVAGPGVPLGRQKGRLVDVAPTVASLAGCGVPRFSIGTPLIGRGGWLRAKAVFAAQYARIVAGPTGTEAGKGVSVTTDEQADDVMSAARAARTKWDRKSRLGIGLLGALAAIAVIALIGVGSWRALVATFVGSIAYYVVYNTLFFGVHGYLWSLSAFNSEDKVGAWMNGRMIEAALSLFVAVVVASLVYPLMRREPRRAGGDYLAGWLTLGPATALMILATLGLQVAWFAWAYGVVPVWSLPNLMWGFKYDLDLIQATAVGFSAVLSPVVSGLIGRYHPSVR